ncbi:MAG: hypothetical protein ACOC1K_06525 [Nanoarchaeota archaeon]
MPSTKDAIHEGQIGLTACETKVKYKDVFHLKNLYRYMHEWLINDGWGNHSDEKWPEVMYMSNQRHDGEEVWTWWRLERPNNNYMKSAMDVDMHVLYLKNVEKVINGKKVKAQNGECEVIIRGRLVVDPDSYWRKHWLLKHLNQFYWRRFNKLRVEQQKQELYQDCYKFHAAIKNFFRLYQVEPDRKPFRSHGGLETGV